jgi:putative transposase
MRKKTPSFIAEFPLATTPADEQELSIRLDAARNVYNACLGESLRRLDLMRESKAWQAAQAMPKHSAQAINKSKDKAQLKADNKARADAFKAVEDKFEFNSCSIQKFGQQCRDGCWIGDHLGSHDTQTTTLRAFRSVEQYAFGKRGRPCFKRFNELESIEGKEQAVIRYKADPIPALHYSGLVIPLMLDPKDKDGWQQEALACRVKYTRILRRKVRDKTRWYAQIVMEGSPPTKGRVIGQGVVGLDIGPSTIASFSLEQANLEPFCPTVTQPWKELRRIERAMDRSRRATNPEHFNANGTVKKGKKKWKRSRRFQKLALKRKERERRLAAERKRSHGQLANRILAEGKTVKTEKLSYKSFQKCFGKSVKVRAPGMLVSTLERKAKAAGGELIEIPTWNTRLSQFDHTTGQYVKKPLSQREHVFGDGITAPVQRDLYSAFLAFCCIANILDIRQVQKAWPSAEPLLQQAMSRFSQSASGKAQCFPQGLNALGADRLSKKVIVRCEAADAVAKARAAESIGYTLSEPPGFSHGEVQPLVVSDPRNPPLLCTRHHSDVDGRRHRILPECATDVADP